VRSSLGRIPPNLKLLLIGRREIWNYRIYRDAPVHVP
jgi:hypothetical protein